MIGLQSDDRLVLAAGDENDSSLFRLRGDGTPDTEFGDDGSVTTSDASYVADGESAGLAVGADDSLYVSEHSRDEADSSYAVAHLAADGDSDPSFAGGRATVDFGPASGATWTSGLALGADDAVTVVGSVYSDSEGSHLLAARFDSAGALDTTFGQAGLVDLSVPNTSVWDLAALDDRRTAVLGFVYDPLAYHGCCADNLFSIDPDGRPGGSFPRAGIQRALGGSVTRPPEGGLLFTGTDYPPYGGGGPLRIRVSLYRPSGELDGAFSGDGTTAVRIGGLGSTASTVAPGPGGAVLVGGSVSSGHCRPSDGDPAGSPCESAVVMRFRRDGRLDPSFGRGGVAALPRFGFCPAMPTTRCGFDLDADGFAEAVTGAVSPRAHLDGRHLRVRVGCPRVVATPCRFRLNATARKRDRLGARPRAVVVKPGRTRSARLTLRQPVARRVARSGSAIVWSVVRAATQRYAARSWTAVTVQGGIRDR